jgi:hypothetical protein
VSYTDGTYDRIPDIPSVDEKGTVLFVSAAGKQIKSFGKISYAGDTLLYYDEFTGSYRVKAGDKEIVVYYIKPAESNEG